MSYRSLTPGQLRRRICIEFRQVRRNRSDGGIRSLVYREGRHQRQVRGENENDVMKILHLVYYSKDVVLRDL